MRIRSRLFLTYLAVGGGLVAVAGAFLYPQVAREARAGIESRLDGGVRIVVADLERGDLPLAALDERVDALAQAADARMTVVAADGRVLADSEFDGAALAELENHAGRPEIEAARDRRQGHSVRYSRSVEADLLYHARLVEGGPLAGSVVRGGVPLTRVAAARREAGGRLALALAVALVAAAGMGALMARRLSGPVRELRESAVRVAAGDLTARPRVQTGDELEELAHALQAATERLADRIAAAHAERDRLEGVLEAMVEGVVVIGADGRVAMANAAMRRLFGAAGPLEGRTPLQALRHPGAADALAEAARQGPVAREVAVGWPRERTLALQAVSLPAGGAVGVFHDVTERRRLDAVRRDFVANVSHELRTPLATLAGYAEELAAPGLGPDQTHRSAEVIRRHVARMAELVDDLLVLARIEAEGFAPAREPVDVAALAEEAAREWSGRADARRMRLYLDAAEPASVEADPRLLRNALDNLIENALRHCPDGTTVRLAVDRRPGEVEISVADDGPGIPPEDQGRIFERFYRVEKGRSREAGGTGLGLAIVKHIVEVHGGRATVESRVGAGTTFRLFLPA
jgi:two-component system phosphate regulon sensor histidine kinase PhoR